MSTASKEGRKRNKSRLATQIRISYLILLLPNIVFMVFAFYNLWKLSVRYDDMLNSVVVASEFSLDFKNDFDYETYLLIVGNVAPADSKIPQLLSDARGVVDGLKMLRIHWTTERDFRARICISTTFRATLTTSRRT